MKKIISASIRREKGSRHAWANVHGLAATHAAKRFGVDMGRGRFWFVGENWDLFLICIHETAEEVSV